MDRCPRRPANLPARPRPARGRPPGRRRRGRTRLPRDRGPPRQHRGLPPARGHTRQTRQRLPHGARHPVRRTVRPRGAPDLGLAVARVARRGRLPGPPRRPARRRLRARAAELVLPGLPGLARGFGPVRRGPPGRPPGHPGPARLRGRRRRPRAPDSHPRTRRGRRGTGSRALADTCAPAAGLSRAHAGVRAAADRRTRTRTHAGHPGPGRGRRARDRGPHTRRERPHLGATAPSAAAGAGTSPGRRADPRPARRGGPHRPAVLGLHRQPGPGGARPPAAAGAASRRREAPRRDAGEAGRRRVAALPGADAEGRERSAAAVHGPLSRQPADPSGAPGTGRAGRHRVPGPHARPAGGPRRRTDPRRELRQADGGPAPPCPVRRPRRAGPDHPEPAGGTRHRGPPGGPARPGSRGSAERRHPHPAVDTRRTRRGRGGLRDRERGADRRGQRRAGCEGRPPGVLRGGRRRGVAAGVGDRRGVHVPVGPRASGGHRRPHPGHAPAGPRRHHGSAHGGQGQGRGPWSGRRPAGADRGAGGRLRPGPGPARAAGAGPSAARPDPGRTARRLQHPGAHRSRRRRRGAAHPPAPPGPDRPRAAPARCRSRLGPGRTAGRARRPNGPVRRQLRAGGDLDRRPARRSFGRDADRCAGVLRTSGGAPERRPQVVPRNARAVPGHEDRSRDARPGSGTEGPGRLHQRPVDSAGPRGAPVRTPLRTVGAGRGHRGQGGVRAGPGGRVVRRALRHRPILLPRGHGPARPETRGRVRERRLRALPDARLGGLRGQRRSRGRPGTSRPVGPPPGADADDERLCLRRHALDAGGPDQGLALPVPGHQDAGPGGVPQGAAADGLVRRGRVLRRRRGRGALRGRQRDGVRQGRLGVRQPGDPHGGDGHRDDPGPRPQPRGAHRTGLRADVHEDRLPEPGPQRTARLGPAAGAAQHRGRATRRPGHPDAARTARPCRRAHPGRDRPARHAHDVRRTARPRGHVRERAGRAEDRPGGAGRAGRRRGRLVGRHGEDQGGGHDATRPRRTDGRPVRQPARPGLDRTVARRVGSGEPADDSRVLPAQGAHRAEQRPVHCEHRDQPRPRRQAAGHGGAESLRPRDLGARTDRARDRPAGPGPGLHRPTGSGRPVRGGARRPAHHRGGGIPRQDSPGEGPQAGREVPPDGPKHPRRSGHPPAGRLDHGLARGGRRRDRRQRLATAAARRAGGTGQAGPEPAAPGRQGGRVLRPPGPGRLRRTGRGRPQRAAGRPGRPDRRHPLWRATDPRRGRSLRPLGQRPAHRHGQGKGVGLASAPDPPEPRNLAWNGLLTGQQRLPRGSGRHPARGTAPHRSSGRGTRRLRAAAPADADRRHDGRRQGQRCRTGPGGRGPGVRPGLGEFGSRTGARPGTGDPRPGPAGGLRGRAPAARTAAGRDARGFPHQAVRGTLGPRRATAGATSGAGRHRLGVAPQRSRGRPGTGRPAGPGRPPGRHGPAGPGVAAAPAGRRPDGHRGLSCPGHRVEVRPYGLAAHPHRAAGQRPVAGRPQPDPHRHLGATGARARPPGARRPVRRGDGPRLRQRKRQDLDTR